MDIKTICQLDPGTSNLTCKGKVGYVGEAKKISGEKNGKPYLFWSQFVVIEDNTGSIGVNVSDNSSENLLRAIKKDSWLTVEKGKVDTYEKDGETKTVLRGRLVSQPPSQTSQDAPESTNSGQRVSISPESQFTGKLDIWKGYCELMAHQEGDFNREAAVDDCWYVYDNFLMAGKNENPSTSEPNIDESKPQDEEEILF